MAGGDAVVLQRLMMLLTAPLSRLDSPEQVCVRLRCMTALGCLALAHRVSGYSRRVHFLGRHTHFFVTS